MFYSSQKSDLKIKNVIEIKYNLQQNKSNFSYKKKIEMTRKDKRWLLIICFNFYWIGIIWIDDEKNVLLIFLSFDYSDDYQSTVQQEIMN